jgi:23S rRNA (uracil747-C5)-methyltransferase
MRKNAVATTMYCQLNRDGLCHSCRFINIPYSEQLQAKQKNLQQLLSAQAVQTWLPPVASPQRQFRNKAKMVVSGSTEQPILGILNPEREAVDLSACPLYPADFQPVFDVIKRFISRAGLTPYHVVKRRGELKYILLTENRYGEKLLRFVLRSEQTLKQIKTHLPWLLAQLPTLKVISVNIQPVPMAIIEGEQEIYLTEQQAIPEVLNKIPLWIRPQSFFQTNSAIAECLYLTAQHWVQPLAVQSIWDLFCGVGGFGLHCATKAVKLTGIEISPGAISCAQDSARKIGLSNVNFTALDSNQFAVAGHNRPDLVIVNPPRRGLGEPLSIALKQMAAPYLLYSSCNPASLAADLAKLDNYQIEKVQLFDLFQHSAHYEVLTLLTCCE